MYTITQTKFGFKLTFGGFIQNPELEGWLADSEKALTRAAGPFGVFVDMRALKPLPRQAQETMVAGQLLYKRAGMTRSVVVLNDGVTLMQFRRLAKQSGIDAWERYVDASTTPNWEQVALMWLLDGVDPDTSDPAQSDSARTAAQRDTGRSGGASSSSVPGAAQLRASKLAEP
jgi:hypothetical protein